MVARFSAPVHTGPGAHPASCTMGTGSFSGVNSGRGVTMTPHPLLVPWSRKCRAIPLLPLWAVRPVQSLSACTRVTFTFTSKVAPDTELEGGSREDRRLEEGNRGGHGPKTGRSDSEKSGRYSKTTKYVISQESYVLAKIQTGNLPNRDPEHCLYSIELGVIRRGSRVTQHDCLSANKKRHRF